MWLFLTKVHLPGSNETRFRVSHACPLSKLWGTLYEHKVTFSAKLQRVHCNLLRRLSPSAALPSVNVLSWTKCEVSQQSGIPERASSVGDAFNLVFLCGLPSTFCIFYAIATAPEWGRSCPCCSDSSGLRGDRPQGDRPDVRVKWRHPVPHATGSVPRGGNQALECTCAVQNSHSRSNFALQHTQVWMHHLLNSSFCANNNKQTSPEFLSL